MMNGIGRLEACATAEGFSKKDVPFVAGLFFLGLFLFLFYTWAMPLIDPDEPRYASTAREMALNGDWIVPHFNGEPRINKPPIVYWAIALCYKLFGIHELGARLPSALAAIGTVMIVYFWGKRIEGRKSGFWAGVMLMASPLFFFIARFCITDMLLTFFFSAALYQFFVEYRDARKKNTRRLLLYFFLSMIFLVKGPVGVLLFILITCCFLLWVRDFRYIRRLW
ncbi:MAG: glycosyltransferase family 39 protein, partial [Planctomycetota bacterium]